MSINVVVITGNVVRDCDLRETPSGLSVANFTVAVNDKRKQQNGEWVDYAHYIDCVMFDKKAEIFYKYLTKGKKVTVNGSLSYSRWETENGTRSKIEVKVDYIDFMSIMSKADKRDNHSEELPF